MSDRLIFVGILLTLACAISALYFMKAYYVKNFKLSVMLKGLCGIFFVLFGLVKIVFESSSVTPRVALVAVALVFGLAGDELLALRHINKEKLTTYFVIGAMLFSGEHFLVVSAVLIEGIPNILVTVMIFITAFVLSIVYLLTRKMNAGPIQKSAFMYIALLSVMSGLVISVAIFDPTLPHLLMALGGICFIVSDNVLLVYNFGEKREWWINEIVHITYYSAQLLFGWALLSM